MKKQVVFIHGGATFDTYENYIKYLKNEEFDLEEKKEKVWKDSLEKKLGDGYKVSILTMPCKHNAKYNEWEIWIKKVIPYIKDGVVFIGHSLGGIFLAKYLAENVFPKKILATYLIASPYDDEGSEHSLGDFILPNDLAKLEKQGGKIFIYHSEDDQIVPFVDVKKYKKALPCAEIVILKDKGHFMQEEFPELIKSIKNLVAYK